MSALGFASIIRQNHTLRTSCLERDYGFAQDCKKAYIILALLLNCVFMEFLLDRASESQFLAFLKKYVITPTHLIWETTHYSLKNGTDFWNINTANILAHKSCCGWIPGSIVWVHAISRREYLNWTLRLVEKFGCNDEALIFQASSFQLFKLEN